MSRSVQWALQNISAAETSKQLHAYIYYEPNETNAHAKIPPHDSNAEICLSAYWLGREHASTVWLGDFHYTKTRFSNRCFFFPRTLVGFARRRRLLFGIFSFSSFHSSIATSKRWDCSLRNEHVREKKNWFPNNCPPIVFHALAQTIKYHRMKWTIPIVNASLIVHSSYSVLNLKYTYLRLILTNRLGWCVDAPDIVRNDDDQMPCRRFMWSTNCRRERARARAEGQRRDPTDLGRTHLRNNMILNVNTMRARWSSAAQNSFSVGWTRNIQIEMRTLRIRNGILCRNLWVNFWDAFLHRVNWKIRTDGRMRLSWPSHHWTVSVFISLAIELTVDANATHKSNSKNHLIILRTGEIKSVQMSAQWHT